MRAKFQALLVGEEAEAVSGAERRYSCSFDDPKFSSGVELELVSLLIADEGLVSTARITSIPPFPLGKDVQA